MPDVAHAPLEFCLSLVGIGCLLIASLHDLIARTAPDGAAVALLLAGLALRALQGTLLPGVALGLLVLLLAALCWRRGWMGGGDVKLLAAAAVFIAPRDLLTFIVAVALAGGVLALLYLAARFVVPRPPASRPRSLLRRALRAEAWRIRRGGPLPYACAIAAGGLFVLL